MRNRDKKSERDNKREKEGVGSTSRRQFAAQGAMEDLDLDLS